MIGNYLVRTAYTRHSPIKVPKSVTVDAATAVLSTTGVGSFANAYPDSGLGIAGAWYFNDRFKVLGLISDANADRTTWREGDLEPRVGRRR